MNKTIRTIVAIALVGIITMTTVMIANKLTRSTRIADMTEHKLYSLSGGTTSMLGELSQPIELRLYYSRTGAMKAAEGIRFFNMYYLYVRDLLDEYVRLSNGNLTLKIIDPRPYSEEEEEAIRHGLRRYQIKAEEGFFFGMVAVTELGKDKVIEFFDPQKQGSVEYEITKSIAQLVQRDKRKIGVIAGLPITGSDLSPYMMQMMMRQGQRPPRPWVAVQDLQQQEYDVKSVKADEQGKLPGDLDFLVVAHPKNVDEKTLFAIDQYVMGGGKLLVLTDPHCMMDRPPQKRNPYGPPPPHNTSSNLNALLEKWGVRMDEKAIVMDRKLALKVPLRRDQNPVMYPPFIELKPEQMSKEEVITLNDSLGKKWEEWLDIFVKNEIRARHLVYLTHAHLEKMGMSIGDRMEFFRDFAGVLYVCMCVCVLVWVLVWVFRLHDFACALLCLCLFLPNR